MISGMTESLRDGVAWFESAGLVPYDEALAWMEARARGIADGSLPDTVWLLEHPPIYTAGTSAVQDELIDARFPVFAAGRGGRYTYHGPGQRIVYVMLDLSKRGRDVRCFVNAIEAWIIAALAGCGVAGRRESGRIGIWVDDPMRGEAKIAAIGVRVRRWVSLHGFAINRDPDLSHFGGIIPCGIGIFGVTSLSALGHPVTAAALDVAIRDGWAAFDSSLPLQHLSVLSITANATHDLG